MTLTDGKGLTATSSERETMRRFETNYDTDPPEVVCAERLDAIAYDLERIADALEEMAENKENSDT